jgi:amidophosphoribosyltransferase
LPSSNLPLTSDMVPYKSINEECGVFGILDKNSAGLGHTLYFGLYALQHRGQESCGMAVFDNHQLRIHKEMGLVNQVFNEGLLDSLTGQIGIGHTRYSTTGASNLDNAQPVVARSPFGGITLAHNGNLINTEALREFLKQHHYLGHGSSDSHLMLIYINYLLNQGKPLKEAVKEALESCEGAYSIVISTGDTLIAARDKNGLRPFCMGRTPNGALVVASETCALDIVGATYERDIMPGEILIATMDDYYAGLETEGKGHTESIFLDGRKQENLCVFELVYFARPDSMIHGQSVYNYRMNLGRRLAQIAPNVEADIVIPVPDSGNVAAVGYSRESGIPYVEGLIKNRYVGRTFISPTHELREKGIQLKLNPLKDVLNGKRVIVVDDSIVRGNTSRNLVKMLKSCGAKEVHFRISSAKVTNPCFYGIDMSQKKELIANQLPDTEAIRDYLGVDSLVYLSVQDMVDIASYDAPCTACFSGEYPAGRPEDFAPTCATAQV